MRANVNLLTLASQTAVETGITGYENSTAAHASGDWGVHNQIRFYATPFAEYGSGDTIVSGYVLRVMLTGTNVDGLGFSIGTGDAACTVPAIITGASLAGAAPYIIRSPESLALLVGEIATFIVKAISATPITYQWRKDGTDISGATDSTFIISRVEAADQAQYDVVVSNEFDSATSAIAVLTVEIGMLARAVVTNRGTGQFNVMYATVDIVVRGGTRPYTYAWYRSDGRLVPGVTTEHVSGIQVTNPDGSPVYHYVVVTDATSLTTQTALFS